MDMTEAELEEMVESLREMFDEYVETLDRESSREAYGTQAELTEATFTAFLKWLKEPDAPRKSG
jgi:hypothetical protein